MKKLVPKLEVHLTAPHGFVPRVEISACYLEIDNNLLLLQRAQGKLEPGKWGVPAGKIEKNESPEKAAIRELFEETSITVENFLQLESLDSLYIRKPEIDYIYHMFRVQLDQIPNVNLSREEHQHYIWASAKDIKTLPLMDGAIEALHYYQGMVPKK
ncbi:MAG: NUDIX hydrolase [Candidatus Protochlamydia sp.]|nr:NUDIX hydrolase [Candidatus Protochlamydia sp.]